MVRAAYSAAAESPEARHPFPVGKAFAVSVGYTPDSLDQIPSEALQAFAGVSNVPSFADIPEKSVVLDIGCGAGLDSLLLARRAVGGSVIGIDFSSAMLARAQCAAARTGASNVLFCRADAERLPIGDGSVDVAVANGIFNLNPAREAIFRELARCLRTGGRFYGAELILREALPAEARVEPDNWFA